MGCRSEKNGVGRWLGRTSPQNAVSHIHHFTQTMAAPVVLKLVSKSGELFEVEKDLMSKSGLVMTLLADMGENGAQRRVV